MKYTMFTSKKGQMCKGQKKYHLLPYNKDEQDIYFSAPYRTREEQRTKRLVLRRDLSKSRKNSIDMRRFG